MRLEKHFPIIALTILIMTAAVFMLGCDDDPKPVWHYKVYRENIDGSHTLWTMKEAPERDEGFLCWTKEDGGRFCISGKITVDTYQAGVK